MFLGIVVALVLGFTSGVVVDNQTGGKVGNYIVGDSNSKAAPVAPVKSTKK